jgi:hypothetical protein
MKQLLGQTEVSGLVCGFFVARNGENREIERPKSSLERSFVIQFAGRVCAAKTLGSKGLYVASTQ